MAKRSKLPRGIEIKAEIKDKKWRTIQETRVLRQEVSRVYNKVKKRMNTFKKNELDYTGAYKDFMRFSANRPSKSSRSTMDISELRNELRVLNKIDKDELSYMDGIIERTRETMSKTGFKGKLKKRDVLKGSRKYYELYEKSIQFLKSSKNIARHYSSNRVFNSVNEMLEDKELNLASEKNDIDGMIKKVSEYVDKYNDSEITKDDIEVSYKWLE